MINHVSALSNTELPDPYKSKTLVGVYKKKYLDGLKRMGISQDRKLSSDVQKFGFNFRCLNST